MSSVRGGNHQAESAAVRHRSLEYDAAAVRLDGPPDDGQPQATAGLARASRGRSTEEGLEHGRRFIVLDAGAAIFYRDLDGWPSFVERAQGGYLNPAP